MSEAGPSGASRTTSPGSPDAPQEGASLATIDPLAARAHTEGTASAVVSEFADSISNPEHPMGPFKDPHSTMIAGIEEHVGYIPGWLLFLMILAVALAMIMWYPTSY